MTLTDRDRKILVAIVPTVLLAAAWFLLLAPKREEAAAAADEVAKQERRHEAARETLRHGAGARARFAADYATVVRLGKALPSGVDTPSLLVQLEAAAKGTGIDFGHATVGQRASAAPAAGGAGGTPPGGTGSPASSPAPAQSGPGQAAQGAGQAAASGNQAAGAPGGGGAGAGGGPPTSAGGTALDSVPLELTFTGSFFRLADFFHRVKRFVEVENGRVAVRGRLIEIDAVKFDSAAFPRLKAELHATVYLVPKSEDPTAGASPAGPAGASPASSGSGAGAAATPSPTPAAGR